MSATHTYRLRVRYSETDQMGIVHHAAYVIWLEEARTALMREVGVPYDELERQGWAVAVRRVDVRYRQTARYGDEVVVETRVGKVGGASIRFDYRALRVGDDTVLLTGSVETVSLDKRTLKPAALPDPLRAAVEALPEDA